jgi:hypothetical protein
MIKIRNLKEKEIRQMICLGHSGNQEFRGFISCTKLNVEKGTPFKFICRKG